MWSLYNTTTTTTTVLRPLCTSACVSRHLQLRTGGHFVGAKFYCQHSFADGKSRTLIGSHILQVAGYHQHAIPMTRNAGSYILVAFGIRQCCYCSHSGRISFLKPFTVSVASSSVCACGCMCVCLQGEICSNVESTACDVQFPVEVTGGHMRPVVLLEKLDLIR